MYKRLTAQIWGVTAFFAVALFAQESSGVAPKKDSVATVQDSVAVADSAATDSVTTDPLASPEMMAMSEIPADSIVYAAVDSLALMESQISQSCSGVTDENLCVEWMKTQSFATLQRLDSLLCQNQESIHACKIYLDSVPREKLGPYLRSLDKKFLLEFYQVTTVDSVYDKEMTKGECFRDLNEIVKTSKRRIADAEEGDSLQFEFGACAFDDSKQSKLACTKMLNAFVQARKKQCATEVVLKETREKFEHREKVKLFDRNMDALWAGLWNLDWFDRDSNWVEDMKFLQSKGYGYSEENLVEQIRTGFQKTDDVWNFLLLNACSVYPTIDDAYEKRVSFRLFDCDKIFEMHKTSCDGSVKKKSVPRTMNGLQASEFVCDAELHRWRLESDNEKMFGLCTEKNMGTEKKTSHGIVICDKNWKMLSKADTWDSDFSGKKFVKGKFRPKRTYFKDSRDGKIYRVVQAGDQVWMATHLNYSTLWGSKCAEGSKEQSCTTLGRLYNWETAKHVCPEGWHLPDSTEWTKLYTYLRGRAHANLANKLLTSGTFVWQASKGETSVYYWLPNQDDNEKFTAAESMQAGVEFGARSNKHEYYPVRCVQDY